MSRLFAVVAGVSSLAFVAFATLSPIELRPTTELGLGWEHLIAFAVIAAFLTFASPKRIWQILVLVILVAILLEVAQLYVPGRHARWIDGATKIFGSLIGVTAGWFIDRWLTARERIGR